MLGSYIFAYNNNIYYLQQDFLSQQADDNF